VAHGGFLIPNAGTVTEPLLSEPDKVDFNTMANARWGVLSGCQVTGQGSSQINVAPGTAMVNGKFVYVSTPATPLTVSIPTGLSKFDLILVNDAGVPYVYPGEESADPFFPDPPVAATLLAAVYCKSGQNLADYVIDKRKFLAPALLSSIGPDDDLIRNFKGPGATESAPLQDYYRVRGDGRTVWEDTTLSRSAVKTLLVEDNLVARSMLSAESVTAVGISATGDIQGRNLRRGTSLPVEKNLGDFFQNYEKGKAYLANHGPRGELQWDEIATMGHMIPVGTVIMSVEVPARMEPLGWLPMNGRTAMEVDFPQLFTLSQLAPYISGYAPTRLMTIPDMTSRFPLASFSEANVGKVGPGDRTTNTYTLAEENIPLHDHAVNPSAAAVTPAGIIQATTGTHIHTLPDHSHKDTETPHTHDNGLAVLVGATVTPMDPLDAGTSTTQVLTPPYTGKKHWPTGTGYASVKGGGVTTPIPTIPGGPHGHPFEGTKQNHDHDALQATYGQHPPAPINFTPNYFTLFFYIRS
jgi:hypothetical protein